MDWMVVSVLLQEGIEANLGHRSSSEVPIRFRHEFCRPLGSGGSVCWWCSLGALGELVLVSIRSRL